MATDEQSASWPKRQRLTLSAYGYIVHSSNFLFEKPRAEDVHDFCLAILCRCRWRLVRETKRPHWRGAKGASTDGDYFSAVRKGQGYSSVFGSVAVHQIRNKLNVCRQHLSTLVYTPATTGAPPEPRACEWAATYLPTYVNKQHYCNCKRRLMIRPLPPEPGKALSIWPTSRNRLPHGVECSVSTKTTKPEA